MTQTPGASPGSPEPVPPPGQSPWPGQSQPPPAPYPQSQPPAAPYPGYQPYPPGYQQGQYPPAGSPQPAYPQGQYPPAGYRQPAYPQPQPAAATPGLPSRLWLLLTIPLGLTTWAAFLYIGIRAARKRWLAWAALYALGLVAFLVLSTNNSNSPREGVAVGVTLLTWIGGGIHALAISRDATRRIQGPADPALEAAKLRIQRRAQGRQLLATQPALAREIGLGRPDVPGADDYGLVDVNHVSADGLTRLPGVTRDLAHRIVTERTQCGGFSSVEDLGMLLNLPPAEVDKMRDMAIFIPD